MLNHREVYIAFVYFVGFILTWYGVLGHTGPETIVASAICYPLFRGGVWAARLFLEGFFVSKGVKASRLLAPSSVNPLRQPRTDIQDMPSSGFVYVMKGQHGMVKVGITTNLDARIRAIRTGSAFPVEFVFAAPCSDALSVEREAHKILDGNRMNGEWFDVPAERAIEAVRLAATSIGARLF